MPKEAKDWEVVTFAENHARGAKKVNVKLMPLSTNRVDDLLRRIRAPKNRLYNELQTVQKCLKSLNIV